MVTRCKSIGCDQQMKLFDNDDDDDDEEPSTCVCPSAIPSRIFQPDPNQRIMDMNHYIIHNSIHPFTNAYQ